MPRQHSPRRPTPAEQMYHASQDRIWERSGSRYPCSQSELDFHHWGRFDTENSGPFVSLWEATEEVMVQNDERRRLSPDELEATAQLNRVVRDRTYRYHPDIIVKAFKDLDTVFFGGRLHGNVIVSWANQTHDIEKHVLGDTSHAIPWEEGQARILLNPRTIFLRNTVYETPLQAMFSTLLHEVSFTPFLTEAFSPSMLTSSRITDGSCVCRRPMWPSFRERRA